MKCVYEIRELNEKWEDFTTKIEALYESLDELEEVLDNLEQDYVGDKEAVESDCGWAIIKQCTNTIKKLQERIDKYEIKTGHKYNEIKEVITSHETYEEFVSGIRKKVLGY